MSIRRNVNVIKSIKSGDIIDLGLNGHNEYYIVAYQAVGGKILFNQFARWLHKCIWG